VPAHAGVFLSLLYQPQLQFIPAAIASSTRSLSHTAVLSPPVPTNTNISNSASSSYCRFVSQEAYCIICQGQEVDSQTFRILARRHLPHILTGRRKCGTTLQKAQPSACCWLSGLRPVPEVFLKLFASYPAMSHCHRLLVTERPISASSTRGNSRAAKRLSCSCSLPWS